MQPDRSRLLPAAFSPRPWLDAWSRRAPAWLAAAAVACVALGWLTGGAVAAAIATALVMTVLAMATGLLLAASDRSHRQRVEGFMRVAVRAYWEVDAQQRLTYLAAPSDPRLQPASPWLGTAWHDLPLCEGQHEACSALRARFAARQPFRDVRVKVSDREYSVGGEPRFDAHGRFAGFWGVIDDVSDRARAQREVEDSEARYRELFENNPMPLVVHRDGVVLDANDAAVSLFGYDSLHDMRGTQIFDRQIDGEGTFARGRARAAFLMSAPEGTVLPFAQFELRRLGGDTRIVRVSGTRVRAPDGPAIMSFYFDDTNMQRTQAELQAIVRRASIGIAHTREQRFLRANPRFEAMFGWEPGTLAGQPGAVVWLNAQAYEEAGRVFGARLARGEAVEHECEMRRRDGSTFWCRTLAQVVDVRNPAAGTIWITEDVTERRRAEQQLAAARDAAEAANRAKSAFLANMSHEIRTPLNGLMGLARLAQQPGLSPARQHEYLRQILDSARSLSDVLSDILDLSKIEAGRLTLENVTFDLHALLATVHRAYCPLAEARGLELDLHIDEEAPVRVVGDPVRLRQIVTNLLTNALKFTARGRVRIHATAAMADGVRIEVEDTGPGIDPAVLPRLFKPFMQADQSTTRRYGGTGLGLSICHELAQLMGGTVGVSSKVGQGSRFWVELHLAASDSLMLTAPSPLTSDLAPLSGLRVLVAEDNPVNMLIAVATLEQWGVEVCQASNGRDAVERVRERARDPSRACHAVLMDVQMPVLSGHEATRELRRYFSPDELVIIGLTAAALVEERELGLAAGMDEFLTKPIEPDRLRAALQAVRALQPRPRASTG